jgi:hypothetical protein
VKDKTINRKLPFWHKGLLAFLLYLCLLIFHGYIFGYEDQIEIVPVLYQMDHPEIYQNDFFIQEVLKKPVHERWFFIHTLHFFHLFNPGIFLLLHAFFSCVLIMGLDKVASSFIKKTFVRWLSILTVLLILYNINLGGNELYYNSLIPSLVAKALAIWGIYCIWKRIWKWAIPLLICTTFIQPLVGIQVTLLSFLSLIPFSKKELVPEIKRLIVPLGIILAFILPWLYLLFAQHSKGDISNDLVFEILEFRLSHHFFPAWFSLSGFLLLPVLAFIGIRVFRKQAPYLAKFIGWIIVGCVVYTLGVEVFEIPLFLDTQWFKSTIWLKAFGVFAVFHLVEKWLTGKNRERYPILKVLEWPLLAWLIPMVTLISIYLVKLSPFPIVKDRPYDFLWVHTLTPEQEICKIAGDVSEPSAIFAVPPDFTMFKWYSKRNSYVDFKAMIHHKDVMAEWYKRVQFVYEINLESKLQQPDLNGAAHAYLGQLDSKTLVEWKSKGIDYLITDRKNELPMDVVGSNERYVIYEVE